MKNNILIWTMGKVGSSTIYKSLQKNDAISNLYDIHQIHWLTKENIQRVEKSLLDSNVDVPKHINDSKKLLEQINNSPHSQLKVITSFRNLLNVYVSGFFQNINRHLTYEKNIYDSNNKINKEVVEKYIINGMIKNAKELYAEFWIRTELNKLLNFNIYDYQFDYEKKYLILENSNFKLLVLRLENFHNTLQNALSDFLGAKEKICIYTANTTQGKKNSQEYLDVKKRLESNTELKKIFAESQYMKNFYSDAI